MDYVLLDSGEGEKLERFGEYVLRRPDPQALWERGQAPAVWDAADAWYTRRKAKPTKGGSPDASQSDAFRGEWHFNKALPKEWQIEMKLDIGCLIFLIKPTSFKHVGIFPEQLENWQWVGRVLKTMNYEQPTILNLFGYTGGATLAAAKAGASVTHIDASKTAVEWARKNAELSGLTDAPVRWIVEDAMRFVDRELKRGTKYDGIILDPPSFGHGPKDELWKIEEDLIPLVKKCGELLTEKPSFMLLNGYAEGYSHIAFQNLLEPIAKLHGWTVEGGELTIGEKGSTRLLPAGIYARAS